MKGVGRSKIIIIIIIIIRRIRRQFLEDLKNRVSYLDIKEETEDPERWIRELIR